MTNFSLDKNESYWNNFYRNLAISAPSQFGAMVSVELPPETTIVELGCGNGRDTFYFASQGFRIAAIDLSDQAIEACSKIAGQQNIKNVKFQVGSIADKGDLKSLFEKARDLSKDRKVVGYSRFVMHSINDEQEALFLQNVSTEMQSEEMLYFEYRSLEDATLEKTYGNHYRRFVDTDRFANSLIKHGFEINYQITGQGMARYKDEDPFVSRLIIKKL